MFFLIVAIADILMGLMVYELLDPEKGKKASRFLKWPWVDVETRFFDLKGDPDLIRRANKIALKFCILSALTTLMNGILHVYFSMPDLKEILVLITVLGIFPLRYLYIFIKRNA